MPGFGVEPTEWEVDRILGHTGRGSEALFQLKWKTGDISWARLADIKHLVALDEYLEAMGVGLATDLPKNVASPGTSSARKALVEKIGQVACKKS